MGKNGHVHFSDETRQAALFETMILAAGSDGDVSKVEVEEIYRRVFERPEFHGIHASDLRQAISRAAQQVAQVGDLSSILSSIAERLPDRASRELAFGLAASVAWADGPAHPSPRGGAPQGSAADVRAGRRRGRPAVRAGRRDGPASPDRGPLKQSPL